ncbi:type I-E CRISPR-associated protein Cse1/CasA [Bifidobacterium myosotis]|uniref:Type I-E CRISPR-associated protein Cse1/CasA n=1 Tax=Bifidobacterium myosotis TaxID=1630166 RepID=A0A261FPC2_9BIFI|nr:type I-E CRISPR-associated protein Cse1/CasA [Bifidobacterium myosotis]OZG60845.1 type I-E CRISPR-associated protein Cse1/CasA [Bifidobacterium myosotis]
MGGATPVRRFNLLDEPWIPCILSDGRLRELSLCEVFREAPRIRSISGDLPQQNMPLMRLLLAILYCAYCDTEASRSDALNLWNYLWRRGSFDADVLDGYFDEFHDRFYLLDPERPFYQVPGLAYVGDKEYDPVGEMIADVPKPDKFLFSMRSPNALESIDFAQATRWLVFLQAYDTAGIKSPVIGNTHINKGKVYAPKGLSGTGWLGVIGPIMVEGESLFRTLLLNWCLYDPADDGVRLFGNKDDVPPWESDDFPGPDLTVRTAFTGPVDALTFQSRRLRLVPNDDGTRIVGMVNCYGDVIAAYDTDACEKMTAWRVSETQRKKLGLPAPPLMPVTHDAGKALWRGLGPILAVADRDLRPGVLRWVEELQTNGCLDSQEHVLAVFSIHTQGMTYGTQSSVYETGIDDVLTLPLSFSRRDYPAINTVVDIIDKTSMSVDLVLSNYVRNLCIAAGDHAAGGRAQAAADHVREDAYARLDVLFRDRLAGFTADKDYESYGNAWRDDIHRVLVTIGGEYRSDANAPMFVERDSGRMGLMSVARATQLFLGGLNKYLGTIANDRKGV